MNKDTFPKENPDIKETLDIVLKDAQILNISLMAKGSTNRSYLVESTLGKYVLRIPGKGANQLIDRYAEKEIYSLIHDYGIGDETVYINPENGHKMSIYIEGSRHMDSKSEKDIILFTETVHALHSLKLKCGAEYDFYENIEKYEKLKKTASLFKDYDKVKKDIFSLKDFTDRDKDSYVLIHNDLSPENCLFVKDENGNEKCIFIDFEYAAMQAPAADIAYFCVFSNLSEEETDKVIAHYYGKNATAHDYARVYAYIALNGLVHSNWLEFKISLGEDRVNEANQAYRLAKLYLSKTKKHI